MSYYAVARGRIPGIYYTWDECKAQTNGYSDAKFKKHKNIEDANKYIIDNGDNKLNNEIQIFNPQHTFTLIKNTIPEISERDAELQSVLNGRPRTQHDIFSIEESLTYVDDRLVLWTDGACRNNGTNKEIAGVGVYFADNHPYNIVYKMLGNLSTPVTNNRAEMMAVILALKKCHTNLIKTIEIRTDSQYIVNIITGVNKAHKNKDLWDQLVKLTQGIDIKWTHVRGHVGIYGNEQADMLANRAIDS